MMVEFKNEYWINRNGENLGPFSYSKLQNGEKSGEFHLSDLACVVGGDQWEKLGEILGINDEVKASSVESPQRVVVAQSGGLSFNFMLTGFALFLLLVFGGLFLYLKFNRFEQTDTKSEDNKLEEQALDFNKIAVDAREQSHLKNVAGFFQSKDGIKFTGWTKSFYEGDKIISSLRRYEEGRLFDAYTWGPNEALSTKTSLLGGNGIVVEYNQTGDVIKQTEYKLGQLTGTSIEWNSDGQKMIEENYLNGELHGQKISWDQNGQKLEEIFFLNGERNGPYSRWSENGQKTEEGVYQRGKLEGKRTIWTIDGTVLSNDFFENGELVIPEVKSTREIPATDKMDIVDDEVLTKLLDSAGDNDELQAVAKAISKIVKFTIVRLEERGVVGSEIFLELGSGLIEHVRSGGIDPIMLSGSLDWISKQWGISIIWIDDGYFLCELPDEVTLGGTTWTLSEYAESMLGSLRGDSRSLVIDDLNSLFKTAGVRLGVDREIITLKVKRQIWDTFEIKAEEFENADFKVENGVLFFKSKVERTTKKINPQGKSEFITTFEDTNYSFDRRAENKQAGPFFDALSGARVQFKEIKNAALTIRKYSNVVLFSDKKSEDGTRFLFPNATIQLAGISPFNGTTLIRAVKVDFGEIVEEPTYEVE